MSTLTFRDPAAEVEYFTEREQAERDEAADAKDERRERAANRIVGADGFDAVVEQIPAAKKAEIMDAYGRDSHFVWLLSTAFADAFETAADIRVAQGD